MPSAIAVGLMSGTSADGVTACLVRVSERKIKVLRHKTFPYTRSVREQVLNAPSLNAWELSRLNWTLGTEFARAALSITRGLRPRVIGSHGQTIVHGPDDRPRHTLQIAEPAVIAEALKVPVVADFRPQDLAADGQGAPLVPAFDEFLFSKGPLRAVVNIGGVANVSFVGRGKLWSAFDIGPGNALMDLAVRQASGGRLAYDRGGRLAAKGWADARLVAKLLRLPYFSRKPPKSLDKNEFGEIFLKRHFSGQKLENKFASLTLLTASSIAHACRRFAPGKIAEVVVSGGGALNPVLLRALRSELSGIPLKTTSDFGLHPMAKEAACFAWLAWRALEGKPNNCPAATGARGPRILGKVLTWR